MKRLTTSIIAMYAVTLATSAFGAEPAGGTGMAAGFHAGMNLAKQTGTTSSDSKVGFKIGGQLEWQLMDWLYLQPELAFSMKGGTATGTTTKLNLSYIDVPILLKAKFDAGGWAPYFLMGPNLGIATTRTLDGADTSANYKSTDFGLHFGAGAGIPVGDGMSWFLDGRLELGLANLNNTATSSTITAKNQNISFNTGLNFAI